MRYPNEHVPFICAMKSICEFREFPELSLNSIREIRVIRRYSSLLIINQKSAISNLISGFPYPRMGDVPSWKSAGEWIKVKYLT